MMSGGMISCVIVLGLVVGQVSMAEGQDNTPPPAKIRIVLAGDSTVTDEVGWGKGFAEGLKPEAECINESIGGRSSKSFRDEGRWAKVLADKPDYILIQFGHNDRLGKGPKRETDPKTTFPENMARYVDEAREAGAVPVLVTSICIRKFNEDGAASAVPWLAEYAEAVKKVAAEEHVPLLDMQARTLEMYARLGDKGSEYISLINGRVHESHLSAEGGQVVGAMAVEELRKAVPELAPYLSEETHPRAKPAVDG
jgi:pectinesterase